MKVDALAQFVLATMGAGIVTVPAVFKALGINLGLIVLIVAAVLTLMATWLLVSASLNTQRKETYEGIGFLIYFVAFLCVLQTSAKNFNPGFQSRQLPSTLLSTFLEWCPLLP